LSLLVQSEVELRRYRESLGLPDPSGARGAVIPLNDVIIASTAETLRAVLQYMDEQYITGESGGTVLNLGIKVKGPRFGFKG
jgi:hypothetical protein